MLGKSGIEKGSDCLILLRAYDLLGIALDDMANTVKLKRDLCLQIAYNLIEVYSFDIFKDSLDE